MKKVTVQFLDYKTFIWKNKKIFDIIYISEMINNHYFKSKSFDDYLTGLKEIDFKLVSYYNDDVFRVFLLLLGN